MNNSGLYEFHVASKFLGDTVDIYGEPRINHIEDGLVLLAHLNASRDAARAFCLHPIVQQPGFGPDARNMLLSEHISRLVLIFTMEYRAIANGLVIGMVNHPGFRDEKQVRLSKFAEVNHMLIADRTQQYNVFLKHKNDFHPGDVKTHEQYYKTWLAALGVDAHDFQEMIAALEAPP